MVVMGVVEVRGDFDDDDDDDDNPLRLAVVCNDRVFNLCCRCSIVLVIAMSERLVVGCVE